MNIICLHPKGRVEGHNNGLTGYWYQCHLCGGNWDVNEIPPVVILAKTEEI